MSDFFSEERRVKNCGMHCVAMLFYARNRDFSPVYATEVAFPNEKDLTNQ